MSPHATVPQPATDQLLELQLARRRERALDEIAAVSNLGEHRLYSRFAVASVSGRSYEVHIRSVDERLNSCSCPDYRSNTLGTCKHVEGVLLHLAKSLGEKTFARLAAFPPAVAHIFLQHAEKTRVRVAGPLPEGHLGAALDRLFDGDGALVGDARRTLPAVLGAIDGAREAERDRVVVDPAVRLHLEQLERSEAVRRQREWFLRQVEQGSRSLELIGAKLYPYQVEGVLHLAFGGRVLLADDMGLGKTVQAIAAVSLLHQLQGIGRVLVICPASLKHQWAREIHRFTSFSVAVVEGPGPARRERYRRPAFFTLVTYEVAVRDQEALAELAPELVILDEAQRIKNWRTKTADAIKRLDSRHAFVLTGTPLENRLDELYSVFQFVDPTVLGPLWRFNQRYVVGEKRRSGTYKVLGYQHLDELRRRIAPYVLRRTRQQVLHDLPERTDNTFFVPLTAAQSGPYEEYKATVAKLAAIAKRRPLSPKEQQILLLSLTKMRMICDALALHDHELAGKEVERSAPKLAELREILSDEVVDAGRKAIIFSQWTTMLELVKPVLDGLGLGWVLLSGDVPSAKRGALVDRFRDDPDCRVFLSTDAGGVGLNLQAASLVVNLELPWNPAVLEQRIARAHRHGQANAVQVVNLVTAGTIEERMLETLAAKRNVFAGVFGAGDEAAEIRFEDAGSGLVKQLAELLHPAAAEAEASAPTAPAVPERDGRSRLEELAERLVALLPGRVLVVQPGPALAAGASSLVVVVDREPAALRGAVERELGAAYGADAPQLLLMEPEGWAAFQVVAGAAVAREPGYRSPAVAGDDAERRRQQSLAQVGAGLERAARAARLARLVGDGGFADEALPHLRTGLGWSLSSLLALVDGVEPGPEAPSARVVHTRLVAAGSLPAELAARVALARELTAASDGEPPLPAASVGELADVVDALVDAGRAAAAAAALG